MTDNNNDIKALYERMKLTEEEKKQNLDQLFKTLRAEMGLVQLIQSGSNHKNDDYQIEIISRVVDGALKANPNGRGREIALACVLNELSEAEEIRTNNHYHYRHDPKIQKIHYIE